MVSLGGLKALTNGNMKIHKVLALPPSLEEDSIYFVKNGPGADLYIVSNDGDAVKVSSGVDFGLTLGEDGSTAYRGDRGKFAYDHAQSPHVETKTDIGLGQVNNTSDLDKPVSNATQAALDAHGDTIALNDVYMAHIGNTGIADGGGCITVNAGDNTKFDIAAGHGYILDLDTDPQAPDRTRVDWSEMTGIDADYLLSNSLSFIAIDIDGNVVQQVAGFTEIDQREMITLGSIVHPGSIITGVTDQGVSVDGYLQSDLARAIGKINLSGNNFIPSGANLELDKTAGVCFQAGSNRCNEPRDPNRLPSGSESTVGFIRVYDDGSGGSTVSPATVLDPAQYDDGSGSLQGVPNNKWTNQLVYHYPASGTTLVRYGTEVFDNQDDALLARGTSPPSIGVGIDDDLVRTIITIREDATSLEDDSRVTFTQTGKFGLGSGGGGGGGGGGDSFNQDLNTTDSPTFATVTTTDTIATDVYTVDLGATGTVTTTNLAVTDVYATNIGADNVDVDADITTTNLDASGTVTAGGFVGTPQTLTDAATITYDLANGHNAEVTITANRTLALPTNLAKGASGVLTLTQDGTGGRELALATGWFVSAGSLDDISALGAGEQAQITWYAYAADKVNATILPLQ